MRATRQETLIESRDSAALELTPETVAALRQLGQRLASQAPWWGGTPGEAPESTALRCIPAEGGRWKIRVDNAVGVIATDDLQIMIGPKIPPEHLLHLFEQAGAVPRTEEQLASAARAEPLWKLVMTWFVTAAEHLVRRGLVRDYTPIRAEVPVIRGKVHGVRTALNIYRGNVAAHCEFEEFEFDTPVNRVVLAAARVVAGTPVVDDLTRVRARRIVAYLGEDVGDIQPGDLRALIERRTHHYSVALSLAKHVIRGVGRTLSHGDATSWSFLIPTPKVVEEGIRRTIRNALAPEIGVDKLGMQLSGSTLTVNPDLVFGSRLAVGDVKYKLADGLWNRADLYEVVAFAEAFRTVDAIIVAFANTPRLVPAATVQIGDISVAQVLWRAEEDISPALAQQELAKDVLRWAQSLRARDRQPSLLPR